MKNVPGFLIFNVLAISMNLVLTTPVLLQQIQPESVFSVNGLQDDSPQKSIADALIDTDLRISSIVDDEYDPHKIYDVENPFYSTYFTDLHSGMPIPHSFMDVSDDAVLKNDPFVTTEDTQTPYVYDSEKLIDKIYKPQSFKPIDNPYISGIPAQLQSFPLFKPERYYHDYDYEDELMAERQRLRQLREEELRIRNLMNDESRTREKRSLLKYLNLRNKNGDNVKNFKEDSGKNVISNNQAECSMGRGGGRNSPNGNGNGNGSGSNSGDGNAVDGVAGAANDAVDAVQSAADNLRLRNGRRTGGRPRN